MLRRARSVALWAAVGSSPCVYLPGTGGWEWAKLAMIPVSINRAQWDRTVTPALWCLCSNLEVEEGFHLHWRFPSQANLKALKPPSATSPPPPAGANLWIVAGKVSAARRRHLLPSERVMTWQTVLEDKKQARGRGWTKGSFPVHLDLHLQQLGKLCLVMTFDPSSYWTKPVQCVLGPIRFDIDFFCC